MQVDEQVALEEQTRAQLERRVLADREGAVLDVHRDHGRVLPVPVPSVRCWTSLTSPTFTPEIRTGLLARTFWASAKTAFSW